MGRPSGRPFQIARGSGGPTSAVTRMFPTHRARPDAVRRAEIARAFILLTTGHTPARLTAEKELHQIGTAE